MTLATDFRLEPSPLSLTRAEGFLRSDKLGGEVIFCGTVRDTRGDRRVLRLEFEAYDAMVNEELLRIARKLGEQWPVQRILLHHRTGIVAPGEWAVIAGVAAVHRKEAFEACSALMDALKSSVPIWKKEVYEDGEEWVTPTP